MYIYTQTRTTHDSPPPGVQLFTSASVYTGPVGTARQPFKLTRDAYLFLIDGMYSNGKINRLDSYAIVCSQSAV